MKTSDQSDAPTYLDALAARDNSSEHIAVLKLKCRLFGHDIKKSHMLVVLCNRCGSFYYQHKGELLTEDEYRKIIEDHWW